MRHIISVLVENEAGALSRLVGLFSQRNYNIETLNVAPTEDPTLSRLTLTTYGDDHKIEQITKQLNKLVEVVKVVDLSEGSHIERELMLIKVKALGASRAEIKRTADIFRAQIVDVTPTTYTIQIAGTTEKLDGFIDALAENTILEVVRSGVSGIARGEKSFSHLIFKKYFSGEHKCKFFTIKTVTYQSSKARKLRLLVTVLKVMLMHLTLKTQV